MSEQGEVLLDGGVTVSRVWCAELVAGTYHNSVNEKRVLHHRRVRRMTQIEITLRSRYFSRPPAS